MSQGVAVAAMDCETGPAELINHRQNGFPCGTGDVPAFAQALGDLMQDQRLRRDLGERAKEVQTRFAIETIAAQWEALFVR